MSKSQNQFTFKEAKESAIPKIERLVTLAENLDYLFPGVGFVWHVVNLQVIENVVRKASDRCLSEGQIKQIDNFRLHLIYGHAHIAPKLEAFWNLYYDILQMFNAKVSPVPAYAPSSVISQMMPRIEEADNLAHDMIQSALTHARSILSALSLLSVHVKRVELIEYPIVQQLQNAISTFDLTKYDVHEMCSVDSKVRKGSEWKTDVRAIRDAISHGYYSLRETKDDWEIEFHNTQQGYNFTKKLTGIEFRRFFDRHTMLYKVQIHLLIIVELLPILVTHFLRK